jgi:PST family polysaccharide transporter
MIKKLKFIFSGTEISKNLLNNIFSLSILQISSYILPLITIPYLVRVLGPEYFGLLGFSAATIAYFTLLTDYGFNLSATRQVSIYRDDKDKLNEIFSSVMLIKAGLMIVSFCLMSILVFSFERFSQDWEVYFLSFGIVVGQVLFPVWLFQGMERMKFIAYLNLGAKIFFTICIFIFVQKQSDYLLVPLLTSMGFIVAGIWSIFLIKKEFNITFVSQNKSIIKFQLYEGWHVFFSSITISLYTISTTFILGLFTNNTVVGYFSGAEKIIKAFKGLYSPVLNATYPHASKKLKENKQLGLIFINKLTLIVGVIMFLISALLYSFAGSIIELLLGDKYYKSVLLLKIMSFLPFIISLSNIFGIQTMLNLGYKKEFSFFILITAVISIISAFILIPMYSEVGASISLLIGELSITIILGLFVLIKIK